MRNFDVIVVGLGHAGCEAALVAARRGFKVAAFSVNLDNIALMPCNPSIGGPGKSHLVYELTAMGGEMGKVIDRTHVHARILNDSRGPAVYSLRMQADKKAYQQLMRQILEEERNVFLFEGEISDLLLEDKKIRGIKTVLGEEFLAPVVILATGTFLGGRIIIGEESYPGGPHNELPALKLTNSLLKNGIKTDRFQTATPPRVQKSSLDFSKFKELPCDEGVGFSFEYKGCNKRQIPSYLVYTNEKTIEAVRNNLKQSPIVIGNITDSGPRYCPSIDRKVLKFPQVVNHQIFIEPEGYENEEIYLQGLTTSMPAHIQEEILHTVPGFKNVHIIRYGYAIEYDYIPPFQLKPTMENKIISGLYTAGQINGTSGYEEAAVQGFLAGLNATLKLEGREPFIPKRYESYMGVLVEDLTGKEIKEPYRVMTSRAEFRLSLRQDNADKRCIEYGYKYGLIPEEIYRAVKRKYYLIEKEIKKLENFKINPNKKNNQILAKYNSPPLKKTYRASDLLMRKELDYHMLKEFGYQSEEELSKEMIDSILIELKYKGYLQRQEKQIERIKKLENYPIPEDFDFQSIKILSKEALDNLKRERPRKVGELMRVCGVNLNDMMVILNLLKRKGSTEGTNNG